MGTKVISFYDKFTCLASDCPDTCCRGWRISIDPDTVKRYKEEKGAQGLRLRATMSFGKNKEIRRFFNRCANETKEGLCRLERDGRMELMPEVCRIYPRRSIVIGDDEEVTFELSCPLTAKLFLENAHSVSLIPYAGESIPAVWTQDKFDEDFYNILLELRDKSIRYINSDVAFPKVMHNLYLYFRSVHNHLMAKDMDVLTISIDKPIGTEHDSGSEKLVEPTYNFYSFAMFDKVIMNDLNDGRFGIEDPLHSFIKEYNNIFAQMTASKADQYFHKTAINMIEKFPKLEVKYRGYLTYYLIQSLYSSYETVTFYKEYLMGMVYLMALILTDVVDYTGGKDMMDVDRQIKHLNACERRFRHNVGVKKSIAHRVDEEFTKKKEGFIF